jgi:DNA-directed RNA polymerase
MRVVPVPEAGAFPKVDARRVMQHSSLKAQLDQFKQQNSAVMVQELKKDAEEGEEEVDVFGEEDQEALEEHDHVIELQPRKSKEERGFEEPSSYSEEAVYSKGERKEQWWRMNQEELAKYQLQADLELNAIDQATEHYRKALDGILRAKQGASLGPTRRIIDSWYGPFRDSINNAVRKMSARASSHSLVTNLKLLSSDKLPVITLHQTLGMLLANSEGVPFMQVAFAVGRAVQAEVNFERMKAEDKQAFRSLLKSKSGVTVTLVNIKAKYTLKKHDWDSKTIVQLGAFLLKHLMLSANIEKNPDKVLSRAHNLAVSSTETKAGEDDYTPAFVHYYKFYRQGSTSRRQGLLKCHENIFKYVDDGHVIKEVLDARLLPMVVKPVPWVSPTVGGYLYVPSVLMRAQEHQAQYASLWNADLATVFAALNALGETGWRVNEDIYRIVKKVWDEGGGLAALPTREDISFPDPPDDLDTNDESKRTWKRTERKIRQLNSDLNSLRCDTTYKLSVAETLLHMDFYLPHNVDFRGRAYPIPPHLNQLGSDMCRGLLLFKEKKPLGRTGLRWLKIHLANLYGLNKVPFDARVNFVDKNMEKIFDSADRPLDGDQWWVGADDPWQCLATSIEIAKALRSPNPEEDLACLPVPQDGSCNGLQQYAALGGDEIGGRKVNLVPSDAPQDVYSGVATVVAKRVHEDAIAGHELGKLLDGKLDRKVVKQTVMTSVYGVTYIGARLQIHNALSDKDIAWRDDDQLYHASAYITNHTFEALNQMFLGARNIMKWLADCARIIAKNKDPVAWVTPLGLPIVQPYVKTQQYVVKTVVQQVQLNDPRKDLPVNTIKQRSAFPPNYVHSLDSCHMMLTSIECKKRDITYTSVHDSYWTHACTVDQMSSILREQFVELHSQPLLHRLREWFIKRYGRDGRVEFPPVPERGPLDLQVVKQSKYFFH